ncbi:MAG: hypothetical protein COA69_02600 [Robiginitomaculum sp.]|nr:MAG: hypothetical protein COA69_02600 [Robiginitomaculum sp.]
MISKAIIIGLFSTGLVGTGAASAMSPIGIELMAGPVRIETGNGKMLSAHLDVHSQPALVIALKGERSLKIKF